MIIVIHSAIKGPFYFLLYNDCWFDLFWYKVCNEKGQTFSAVPSFKLLRTALGYPIGFNCTKMKSEDNMRKSFISIPCSL